MYKAIIKNICAISFILSLTGCVTGGISVYGPVKTENEGTSHSGGSSTAGGTDSPVTTQIGNRNPDELITRVQAYYQSKGLTPLVQNTQVGIVATAGNDLTIAGLYLDCSSVEQTQNIQKYYRIVTQVWSNGEGSNVSVQVNGYAGLVAADGNDKIKPTACTSTGAFENGLLESLQK